MGKVSLVKGLFLSEKFILLLILINAILIFVSGFHIDFSVKNTFVLLDEIITLFFIVEIVIKARHWGIREYLSSNWNKFDVVLIAFSLPSVINFIFDYELSDANYLLVFRVMRVFKTFRLFHFFPGVDSLVLGIRRALKASLIVLSVFFVYIFIIGIFSFHLFQELAPDRFGNPALALYSTFKVFTIEGWFEIPETLSKNMSDVGAFFTYSYFVFVVLTGGIFGLSLVNSIFVDAMVSDNNDVLEMKIDTLTEKVEELLKEKEK